MDTIAKLPEVKRRQNYLEKQTKGKRHLQFVIWEKPSHKRPYYWVKVSENNGYFYHTHFNFYVYPKGMAIKYYDIAFEKLMSLSRWRKS